MSTINAPKSHEVLGTATAGNAYGHVPGHQYHDVDVIVSRRGDLYRCEAVETWGSSQGYDEEHDRRSVVGHGDSIAAACAAAGSRGCAAGLDQRYLTQALSSAEDEAMEATA